MHSVYAHSHQCWKVPVIFGAQNQIKDSFIHKIKPQSLGNKPVHFFSSTLSFIIITIWATAETWIFHVNNNSFPGLVLWKTFKHVLITMENLRKQKKTRYNHLNINWRFQRNDSASRRQFRCHDHYSLQGSSL